MKTSRQPITPEIEALMQQHGGPLSSIANTFFIADSTPAARLTITCWYNRPTVFSKSSTSAD